MNTQNRLTIIGPAKDLNRFYRDERWLTISGARYLELLEHSRERHAWQFETDPVRLHSSASCRDSGTP